MPPKRSSGSPTKRPSKRIRSAYGTLGAATAADDTARLIASHHLAEHAGGGATYLATRDDKAVVRALRDVSLEVAARGIFESIRFLEKEGPVTQNMTGKVAGPSRSAVGWDVNRTSNGRTTSLAVDTIAIGDFVQQLEEETANRLLANVLFLSYQALQVANDPGVSVIAIASIFFRDRISRLSLSSLHPPTILLNKIPQCSALTDLNLSHSESLRDNVLAKVLAQLTHLDKVNLKACTKVGDASIEALAMAASSTLRTANLSFTAVGMKGLSALIGKCAYLEVLKLQAVGNLHERAINQVVEIATRTSTRTLPLANLRTLKLRQTLVTDAALGRLLTLCSPTLTRLDVSYTMLKSLDIVSSALHTLPAWQLEKLVASGLPLTPASLDGFFRPLAERPEPERRKFKVLKLGSIPSISTKAPGLTDAVVNKLMPSLERLEGLESVSLFGNVFLGKTREPMTSVIGFLGSRCTSLDLTALPLESRHLDGLLPEFSTGDSELGEDGAPRLPNPPRLETLVLDSTKITDEAADAIGHCRHLKALHVAETKISPRFLATVLTSCPDMSILNLTSCRGIAVTQRRNFFEAWDKGEVEL